jgi:large subunit ribosomal protein L22
MTGPKLNEGALLIDETQVATKATARYLRGSASKARQVLDLIRGLDVRRADEVLQFTDRGAAQEVRKVLASAVANAVHNDNQDADELFVLACFADEGPTLKRFRPRARGRASRIRKRTSHITVIVARMSDARLEVVQARQAKSATVGGRRVGTSAQSRRDRVARSRARAESLRSGETVADEGADVSELADDEVVEEAPEAEVVDVADLSEGADDVDEAADEDAPSASASQPESVALADIDEETSAEAEAADVPAGAVVAPEDGSIPAGYEIKGNASSKKFHIPGGRYYDITVAELFFDTVESAEAAGYDAPAADADKVEEAHTDSDDTENN